MSENFTLYIADLSTGAVVPATKLRALILCEYQNPAYLTHYMTAVTMGHVFASLQNLHILVILQDRKETVFCVFSVFIRSFFKQ